MTSRVRHSMDRHLGSPQEPGTSRSGNLRAINAAFRAVGAVALGAVAIGALAIGALAVGRLAIGRARIRRLEIDELVVRRLRVIEQMQAPEEPGPDSQT